MVIAQNAAEAGKTLISRFGELKLDAEGMIEVSEEMANVIRAGDMGPAWKIPGEEEELDLNLDDDDEPVQEAAADIEEAPKVTKKKRKKKVTKKKKKVRRSARS